jgi:hypothetical protein
MPPLFILNVRIFVMDFNRLVILSLSKDSAEACPSADGFDKLTMTPVFYLRSFVTSASYCSAIVSHWRCKRQSALNVLVLVLIARIG